MQLNRLTTAALTTGALTLGVALLTAPLTAPASAQPEAAEHAHPVPEAPAHPLFDRFKSLEGIWQGTVQHGENADAGPATVSYRLTAGGTALVETLFADTPMEMTSVYFLDGDTLKMTHYCLANNQPTMVAAAGDQAHIVHLNFDSITNLSDPGAMHMHHATFEFVGPDHLRSTWQGYVGGQPVADMCAVLDLQRQPAAAP